MFQYLVLLFIIGVNSSPIKPPAAPSCQACHDVNPNKINVHIIAHSHDDVGWLKTVDQYFYGSHQEIQSAGVQYIISSTVEALKADSNRRFVQVETAFFWKWWENQPDSIRQDVIDLVNNGQLEIINGAWSQNDEAATNYQSTIDQFTYGLETINNTLGQCGTPSIAWQIDPFGHSREQASLSSQLGFEALFFWRFDYNDKNNRIATQNMELVWQGSANLDNTNIFTGMFPEGYGSLGGFCFDINCGDEVLNDDQTSPDYNVPRRVEEFQKKIEDYSKYYKTSNILIPMGGDFEYQAAEKNFINLDKLIAGFQDNDKVNLIYSTPSCYVQAVNKEANEKQIDFTVKTDDFFPYASDSHQYWTGYFTSRPNAKRFERTTNNILQAAKQLGSFSRTGGFDISDQLVWAKQAIGILQHHDAITGTAKEAVANDYARLLDRGIKRLEPFLGAILTNMMKKDPTSDFGINFQLCLLANASICEPANADRFIVGVYSTIERHLTHFIRIPVPDGTYKVTGGDGDIPAQLVDSIAPFDYIDSAIGNANPKELVIKVEDIPGFAIQLFYVERTSSAAVETKKAAQLKFGSDTTGFEIDETSGLLKSVTMNGKTVNIKQEFIYYNSFNGDNNGDENAASGAYLFRPIDNKASNVADSVTVTSTTGDLVDEVRQEFNSWVTQIIRVYKGTADSYIEFDWLVGPIDVNTDDSIGKEIVSRFTVDGFDNQETFYTDANGREMIKRQLNKRYDYTYDSTIEPIASNYYPVTSKIVIKDETQKLEVAVLNDRAQGGSSLANGQIELMVHRRTLKDDAKGVAEPLDDIEFGQGVVARGSHYLVIGSSDSATVSTATKERDLALKKLLGPLILVADASSPDYDLDKVEAAVNLKFEGMVTQLPANVHMLSLEPWKEDAYLLRLEHILEKNEDDALSKSATVDLAEIFLPETLTYARETTLGANQWLDEYVQKDSLAWTSADGVIQNTKPVPLKEGETSVTLEPMQIRTFVVRLTRGGK